MPYRVLLVIKGEWWSDQKTFATYAQALRHRAVIAARWNDCDTAISAPDNRVLGFKESFLEQAALKKILAEA